MEMAKQRVIVDDAVIESGEIQEIIDPLWWSVSIYDGEEQYQRDLEGFTAPQRYLLALQWYLAEVNNGGHDQFYSNSTGIVWEDAMNGAREMGMEELYGSSGSLRTAWRQTRQGAGGPLGSDERAGA